MNQTESGTTSDPAICTNQTILCVIRLTKQYERQYQVQLKRVMLKAANHCLLDNKMYWSNSIDWNSITPTAFGKRLRRRLSSPVSPNELINTYNHIIAVGETKPILAAAFSEVAFKIFLQRRRPHDAALFLELYARSSMTAREWKSALKAIQILQSLELKGRRQQELVELADDLRTSAYRIGLPEELIPAVLAVTTAIYAGANETEKQADAYLVAAGHFASNGAIQAAYRAASDAEELAHKAGSARLLARVFARIAVIAYDEKDFDWSARAGRASLDVYEELKEAPPAALLSNTATAVMNTGKHAEAIRLFEEALPNLTDHDHLVRFQLYTNIAACRRQLGDLSGSKRALTEACNNNSTDHPSDARMEFELVRARVMADTADPASLSVALTEATVCLDETIGLVNRLHYRRGIRERYISRIEGLLRALPIEGSADSILLPLAAICGNQTADWMAVLDWERGISIDDALPFTPRSRVSRLVREIAECGAPFLYGFIEKYDDPWETPVHQPPWDQFVESTAQLKAAGARGPFSMATASAHADLLRARLTDGYCVTIHTFGGGPVLWVLTGNSYKQIRFSNDDLLAFRSARRSYEFGRTNRTAFANALTNIGATILPSLAEIFESLVHSQSPGILHLQDLFNTLPMTMFVGEHTGLCERMAAGNFEVRIVPALHSRSAEEPLPSPRITAIRDDSDDLLLAKYEAEVAMSLVKPPKASFFTSEDNEVLLKDLATTEMLIVSTHGQPISQYADPARGTLGASSGNHVINVNRLQSTFPWFQYKLAILNACHAGSGVARNHQGTFRSRDVASYPGLLLLNRQSIVGASGWRTSDTASYVHLVLTSIGLTERLSPSRALSRATARLKNLSKTDTIAALALIPDQNVRVKAIERIALAPATGMFSQPYLYAGFETYGLM